MDLLSLVAAMKYTDRTVSSELEKMWKVVQELPTKGNSKYIYLVPAPSQTDDNIYDEYIWIANETKTSGGFFEHIGSTSIDLSDYAKLEQLATKADGEGLAFSVDSDGILNVTYSEV